MSSKVIFLWFACGIEFVTAKLDFWCVFRQPWWDQGTLAVGFASQDWLCAKCSFLSLSPFCFHQHLGHGPPWMCTLMPLGVKRNQRTAAWEAAAWEPSKVTTLHEQQLECLNFLQDGAFLPFLTNLTKRLSLGLSLICTTTKNICIVPSINPWQSPG